jgi:predicted ATPase
MIYKLNIKDSAKTPVQWLAKVDALKQRSVFEFKPGLNILWGCNGSGKTSLTKVLARLFHCEQGNHPLVTHESLQQLVGDGTLKTADIQNGLQIVHDGQGFATLTQVQFIVASHSLFALKIPEAHYIELSPGYLTGAEAALGILQTWPTEKPPKVSREASTEARGAVKKRQEKKTRDG